MKRLIITICTIILLISGCAPKNKPYETYTFEGFYFDTYISITIYGKYDEAIIDGLKEKCIYYESIFSESSSTSDIGQINEASKSTAVSMDTAILLSSALDMAQKSNGLIDPTIYSVSKLWVFDGDNSSIPIVDEAIKHVDYSKIHIKDNIVYKDDPNIKLALGFCAKGYIGDELKQYLIDSGIKSAILDLGGNIVCIGEKPDGKTYKVGVKKPFSSEIYKTLSIKDCSVVTSAVDQRYFYNEGILYHHILDTSTGYPVSNDLQSVTVIGPSSLTCDMLSTTLFILGRKDALEFIKDYPEYDVIFQ